MKGETGIVLAFIALITMFMGVLFVATYVVPMYSEKLDNYFNPKGEIVEERFTHEHSGILNVYHDNELNVTCWETGYSGLSCLPDADTGI